jgi:hypothetical protein
MKQTIGIIMIIIGLAFLYVGYDKMENSKVGLKIGDLEISAKDKPSNRQSIIYYGLGAIGVIGGIMMFSKNKTL